ncbi:hypothetical protein P4O66_007050, partial [Electrophorus voltai]
VSSDESGCRYAMSSPVSYITTLIRKASRANPSTHRKPGSLSRRRSGDGQGRKARRTEIIGVSQDYERQNVVISKNNNETFGFKIKTYEKNTTDSGQDILTCVSSVREKGPAERAGLRTGDLIIIINNICVEDFVHQRIVDLIHNSSSCLKLEIVRGTTLKQRELQKKLHHLQDQLREKRAELQVLISQEEHLRGGEKEFLFVTKETEAPSPALLRTICPSHPSRLGPPGQGLVRTPQVAEMAGDGARMAGQYRLFREQEGESEREIVPLQSVQYRRQRSRYHHHSLRSSTEAKLPAGPHQPAQGPADGNDERYRTLEFFSGVQRSETIILGTGNSWWCIYHHGKNCLEGPKHQCLVEKYVQTSTAGCSISKPFSCASAFVSHWLLSQGYPPSSQSSSEILLLQVLDPSWLLLQCMSVLLPKIPLAKDTAKLLQHLVKVHSLASGLVSDQGP